MAERRGGTDAGAVRAPLGAAKWVEAIGANSLGKRPFAARTRRLPALNVASDVEHIQFPLKRWDGPVGEWSEHFGKAGRQVYPLDGEPPVPSCNEIEVAKALRAVRDYAFWFSGYTASGIPERWRPWVRAIGSGSPTWLLSLDHEVQSANPLQARRAARCRGLERERPVRVGDLRRVQRPFGIHQ